MVMSRRHESAEFAQRRRVHWKLVRGSTIDQEDIPVAVRTAEELGGRLPQVLLMGGLYGTIVSVYVPRFLPPTDTFSWLLLVGAVLAVLIYLFGLLGVVRARLWYKKHRQRSDVRKAGTRPSGS